MRSVADQLREEDRRQARRLTPAERIDRAFRLGEEGLLTYMRATGLDRETAIRELERRNQRGRRESRAILEIIG